MMYRELNRQNRLELKTYRVLGINQFRRVVFWIEKNKHRGDKRKNENYHPSSLNIIAFEKYEGYLQYNALIHSIGLFLTISDFLLIHITKKQTFAADIFLVILLTLNSYCLMLQRFNHLKIRECCYKSYKRFSTLSSIKVKERVQHLYTQEPQHFIADYNVLERMQNAYYGKTPCILTSADIGSLIRISECICSVSQVSTHQSYENTDNAELNKKINSVSGPYTALQFKTDKIQKKLKIQGRKMLDHIDIVTDDAECENLYKKIIPEDTARNMCFICLWLYDLYTDWSDRTKTYEK